MRFLESLGFKMKKTMTLYMDNKGEVFNNWSTGGQTRAISMRLAYMRELKDLGILYINWIRGDDNPADTKNLETKAYEVDNVVDYKSREKFNI